MLIHRAGADSAASGKGHASASQARQKRAKHKEGGAHGTHQFVGRLGRPKGLGAQGDPLAAPVVHCDAQMSQKRELGTNVLQRRDPPKGQGRLRK